MLLLNFFNIAGLTLATPSESFLTIGISNQAEHAFEEEGSVRFRKPRYLSVIVTFLELPFRIE